MEQVVKKYQIDIEQDAGDVLLLSGSSKGRVKLRKDLPRLNESVFDVFKTEKLFVYNINNIKNNERAIIITDKPVFLDHAATRIVDIKEI